MMAGLKRRLRRIVFGVDDPAVPVRAPGNEDRADALFRAAWARHVAADADGAIAGYREALRADPGHARARENLGVLLLARGEFSRESWEYYGAHLIDRLESAAAGECPAWNGADIRGRSIAVYGHQGLGDQILFASCVPDLVAAGAAATLACDPRLVELFGSSFPQVAVRPLDAAAGATAGTGAQVQCPLGKLARYYRDGMAKFPSRAGYLRADPARVARWREILAPFGPGRRIGIAWRGGDPDKGGRFRSIPLAQWAALLGEPGVHWVSLQHGDCAEELAACSRTTGVPIHHWPEAVADLAEGAALIASLDLVVSVTTTAAHLAGALGRPLLVLVPARPQWRWLLQGDRMPWYPEARLVRQARDGDWSPVLAVVRSRVRDLARTPAA